MHAVSSSANEKSPEEDGKISGESIGDRHIAVDMPSSTAPDRSVPWTSPNAPSRHERDDAFDRDMVTRAISDTGRWAFGTIAVEAWVLDNHSGQLNRPEGALWFDPSAAAVASGKTQEAILRLILIVQIMWPRNLWLLESGLLGHSGQNWLEVMGEFQEEDQ